MPGMLEDEPFGTLINVAARFFFVETYDQVIEELRGIATRPEVDQPPWLRKYRYELKELLLGNSQGLDVERLHRETQLGEPGENLPRRMWAETFPDDPIPGTPKYPFDSLYTIANLYYAERDPDENLVHPDHLKAHFELPDRFMSPLERAIKPDLTRQLAGDFEGLDMVKFRGETTDYYWHGPESGDDKAFARHVWRHLFPDEPLPG